MFPEVHLNVPEPLVTSGLDISSQFSEQKSPIES